MARLPWIDFIGTHRTAHLVAAVIVPTRSAQHLRRLRNLLDRVIGDHGTMADFATAIVRPTEVAQVHCGFADKADADRLARIVAARCVEPLDPWSTHRTFTLDADKEVALAGAVAPSKRSEARARLPARNVSI
jgi:hypothetical protein